MTPRRRKTALNYLTTLVHQLQSIESGNSEYCFGLKVTQKECLSVR